jgi:hypothetical protein
MGKQRVVTDGQPQVLAAPAGAVDDPADKPRCEVIGTCEVPPHCPRMTDIYFGDAPPDDELLEATPDDLDLRELRHPPVQM